METEPEIIESYVKPGKVRLVYRHLVQIGEGSQIAAEGSECAADQGRFWEMRRAIYERQQLFFGDDATSNLVNLAASLGLERETFARCLEQRAHQEMVEADHKAATAAGVRSRPVFTIGDQRLVGALPYGQFRTTLDQALAGN